MKTAIERFMDKVVIEPSGCWRWTASAIPAGYSCFYAHGSTHRAHKWGVEYFRHMKVPKGMECDHLCRNRWCVNPNHIEIVTKSVNMRRGRNQFRERSHCKRGHALVSENIRRMKSGRGHTFNACRACIRIAETKRNGKRRRRKGQDDAD